MIRAAVCGLGIGMAHCAGYLAAKDVELVAVSDLQPERRRRVSGTFDGGSMLGMRSLFRSEALERSWTEIGVRVFDDLEALLRFGEFDVISLCTPDHLHGTQAREILRAGKHLLLEKPVALTRRDALETERAAGVAAARGIRVGVGYEFRRNPAVAKARELCAEIGGVESIAIHHFRTPFKRDKWQSWIQRRSQSGGLIVEETSHWFDLIRFLSSEEIEDLHCVTTDRIHPDFDFEDVAFVDGHLSNGGVFQVEHSLAGFDFSFTISVSGRKGSVWCGLKENARSILDGGQTDYTGIVAWGDPNRPSEEARRVLYGPEAGEPATIMENVRHFAESIETGAPLDCSVTEGRKALEIALLAGLSAAGNKVVFAKGVEEIE